MQVAEQPPSERWRKILTEGHRPLRIARHAFRLIPSAPRCKVCSNPFGPPGGPLLRIAGFTRSRKNPELCARCCDALPPGGAEVDIAILFADVRGSTGIAEHVAATSFAELLERFYRSATEVLLRHDALIDKLIGDELMALFIPGICGPDYRRRAVAAALDVMKAVGYGSPDGPWLSIGAGVNAGRAYVGNVGAAGVTDFTALGDAVNVAARLQALAGDGEVLVAADVSADLAEMLPHAHHETLELRGRERPLATMVAEV